MIKKQNMSDVKRKLSFSAVQENNKEDEDEDE